MEFCGREGISLKGHRDDSTSENVNHGNFKALINIWVMSGDFPLDQHLKTEAKNAQFTSKIAQNDLLTGMKKYMQEYNTKDIVRQSSVNGAAFYDIHAEVRDVSNTEQLGIVIRYINECEPVEKLTEFIKCPVVTVCQKIIGCLQDLMLDPAQCRV